MSELSNDSSLLEAETNIRSASFERRYLNGRRFFVIYGEHESEQAVNIFDKQVISRIRSPLGFLSKNKWLFLVEGGEYGITPRESLHAQIFAEFEKVPILDPIISFTPSTINLTAGEFRRTDPQLEHADLLITAIVSERLMQTYHLPIEAIAIQFGQPVSSILTALKALNDTFGVGKPEEENFTTIKRLFDETTKVTNYVSAQVLELLLKRNPSKTNVLLQLGAAHKPILDIKPSDIPNQFRLQPAKLDELVRERNKNMASRNDYLKQRLLNDLRQIHKK